MIQITGTSGEQTATANIAIQVDAPGLMLSTTNPFTWIAAGYPSSIELDTWDLSGFAGTPNLTITSALPSGVTAVLNPNTPIAPSYAMPSKTTGVSYLTFVPDASMPPSTSNITVTAQAGDVSDTRTVYLVSQAPQFRINIQPMVDRIAQGSSLQMTVSAIAVGNYPNNPITLASSPGFALPAGVTVTFNPAIIQVGQTSTMTVTTDASTPIAPFYITAEGRDYVVDMASDFGWQINVETPPGDLQFEIMPSVPYVAIAQSGTFTMRYTVIDAPGFDQIVSLEPPYTPGTSLDFGPSDPMGSRDVTYNASPYMPSGLWIGEGYGFYGSGSDQEPIVIWIRNEPTLPFILGTQTATLQFHPGDSVSTPVSIALENGYDGTVVLSTIGLPDGITASFDSNPASADTTLHLTADPSLASGSYFVNVTAIANGQTEARTIPIQIGSIATATPVFSPAQGTYTSTQTVSISDSTPGKVIYYTTDGSTPTTASSLYSSPITVSATETIEAIATAAGYSSSPVTTAVYTITPPAAAPVFSPAQGTYTSAQSVSISDSTPGKVIYYTTDGSTPTTASSLYSSPITVSATETIEAIATAAGYSSSPVTTAVYTITPPAAAPVFSPAQGTYTSAQSVSISDSTPGKVIYYTTDGSTPTTSSSVYSSPITVSATETIEAIAAAAGYSSSPVTTAVYTITPPAAAPVFTPAQGTYTSTQTVSISDSTPGKVIYYTTDGSTPTTSSSVYSSPITVSATETIEAIATAAGYSSSPVTTAVYTITPPAAAPVFTPAQGTYTSTQTVSISDSTPGKVIYYTTDGSTPTTVSSLYSSPITVSATETIEAIAVASGYSSSAVTTAVYTITPPAAAPVFSPAQGIYTSTQTVSISDSTPGKVIYYTTDGSTPTTASSVYSSPITVSATETIEAIATATGYSSSPVTTAVYTITPPAAAPTISSLSPAYVDAGSGAFTLNITGSGFTPTSVVYWGGTSLATQLVSTSQLTAHVPATSVSTSGTSAITVQNLDASGSTSNTLQFEIDSASGSASSPTFTTVTATVNSGSAASYLVTTSTSASSISITCLNLPSSSTCSYSSVAGTVTINTKSSTPAGQYQVTVVFNETVPGAAYASVLFPLFLLPLAAFRKRNANRKFFSALLLTLSLVLIGFVTACGGKSNTPVSPTPAPTHQVTSSGIVSLNVQ